MAIQQHTLTTSSLAVTHSDVQLSSTCNSVVARSVAKQGPHPRLPRQVEPRGTMQGQPLPMRQQRSSTATRATTTLPKPIESLKNGIVEGVGVAATRPRV